MQDGILASLPNEGDEVSLACERVGTFRQHGNLKSLCSDMGHHVFDYMGRSKVCVSVTHNMVRAFSPMAKAESELALLLEAKKHSVQHNATH